MSTYYILVNYDLKEYIDSGDLEINLKSFAYDFFISTLLGYLCMDEDNFPPGKPDPQYNGPDQYGEFFWKGHWSGCPNIQLISEYDEIYEQICEQERDYEPKIDHGWVNISKLVAKQWNDEIHEWFDDDPEMAEWVKQHEYKIEPEKEK